MNKTTEALKLAEEGKTAEFYGEEYTEGYRDACKKLYEALAEPVKQELNWGANKFMPHEQPVKQEPVAFMFKVKRTTKARVVLDEFAALDYFPQDGEEIVSKEPLIYAAPVQPVKQEPVVTERQFKLAMKQWEDWKAYALELQEKLVKHEGGSPMILNTAPVQPVQEPVAFVPEVESGAQLMCEVAEWNKQHLTPLYREPVDAKAIRAEALEEAAKMCEDWHIEALVELAAAIRGLK